MPPRAGLGWPVAPGEIPGPRPGGPADAATCRDLASALAARGDARWCLTIVDRQGRAVAHGCARGSPGGPGPPRPARPGGPRPPAPLGWLRSIPPILVEQRECTHRP